MHVVDFAEKYDLIEECWRPKIVAELNGQVLKLVQISGELPWHVHDTADEMFLAFDGSMKLEFRDRSLTLGPGQCSAPWSGTPAGGG